MCKAQKKVSLLLSTKWYELSKRSAFLKDPSGFPILSSKQTVYLFFCPLGSQPPFVKPWKINSYMTHFSPPSICCFIYLLSIYFAIITHLTKRYPIHQITALAASASFNIIFIFSLMGTDPPVLCTPNLFVVVAKHRVSSSQQGREEQSWK